MKFALILILFSSIYSGSVLAKTEAEYEAEARSKCQALLPNSQHSSIFQDCLKVVKADLKTDPKDKGKDYCKRTNPMFVACASPDKEVFYDNKPSPDQFEAEAKKRCQSLLPNSFLSPIGSQCVNALIEDWKMPESSKGPNYCKQVDLRFVRCDDAKYRKEKYINSSLKREGKQAAEEKKNDKKLNAVIPK